MSDESIKQTTTFQGDNLAALFASMVAAQAIWEPS